MRITAFGCIFMLGLLSAVLICAPAWADCTGGTDPCRTVVDSIDTLRNTDTTGNAADTYISVTCYHAYPALGVAAICAGGGDFDRILYSSTDSNCNKRSSLDNGATLIQDSKGNCFYRKNFGLNGVVDARQCGVWGDGVPIHSVNIGGTSTPFADIDLLNSCMVVIATINAQTLQNSPTVVSTGGGVIVDNTDNVKIPGNVTLTCGGTFDGNKSDYRIVENVTGVQAPNLTHAIVIDPTQHQDKNGNPVRYSVTSAGKNALFKDCTEVAGAGALPQGGVYPNPYSPSVFYPDCDVSAYTGTSPCLDDATAANFNETRASSLIQKAFTTIPNPPMGITPGPSVGSIGIVSTSGMNVQNVKVVGFGTCITNQGPKPITQNVDCDGSTGISIHTSDVPRIDDTTVTSAATTGEAGFKIESILWDMAHNLYRVSVDVVTTPTDPGYNYRFADNDIVWIYPQPGKGAESSSGYWVTTNTICPTGTGPCTFDLLGTKQSVTLQAIVNASGYSAAVISSVDPTNSDLKYVQVGQTVTDVTDGGCTIGGLTVAKIWPARGLVYLSGPLTCQTDSGQHSFKFADNTYTGAVGLCGLTNPAPPPASNTGCAMVDPNFRWGDGIYVENSGGLKVANCQVYEHLVSWHLYDGARGAFFTNCGTGNANDLPDRNLAALTSPAYPSGNIVSMLIDGRHIHTVPPDDQGNETDACDIVGVNMGLGQHRNVNVVVQSDCDTPNRLTNVSMGGGVNGIDVEVDAGGISLANSQSSAVSPILKADATELYSYSNGTYAPEGSFAANLTLGGNYLPGVPLIMANTAAAATAIGCGNALAPPPALNCPGVLAVTTITSSITLDGSSELWACDPSAAGADITITIPQGRDTPNTNRTFRVKKVDSSAHACNIVMGGSSDKLDGTHYTSTAPYSLNMHNQSVGFTNANGSKDWYITSTVAGGP